MRVDLGTSSGRHTALTELKSILRRTKLLEGSLGGQAEPPQAASGNPFGVDSFQQDIAGSSATQLREEADTSSGNLTPLSPADPTDWPDSGQGWHVQAHRQGPPASPERSTRPLSPHAAKRPLQEPRLFRAAKSIPRTPLAASLAKLHESEEAWLKERVALKRELDLQRKRAGALEHRHTQLQGMFKHQGLELKSLKAALGARDARIDELERQQKYEHEEAAGSVAAFQHRIDALTGERQELQRLLDAAMEQLQRAGKSKAEECLQEQASAATREAEQGRAEAEERLAGLSDALGSILNAQMAHNRERMQCVSSLLAEDGMDT